MSKPDLAMFDVEPAKTLPFYLVFDVSYSMTHVMGAVNSCLSDLKDAISAMPLLADIARVSVISFSDEARIEFPMGDISENERIKPGHSVLKASGGTSFSAAFRTLKSAIERDITDLKLSGERTVYRPTAFLITDGVPLDKSQWKEAFSELTSIKQYPLVYPFGFGDANEKILDAITYPRDRANGKRPAQYFTVKAGATPGAAIEKIAKVVIQSVVSFTQSATEDRPMVRIDTTGTEDVVETHFLDEM